MLHLIVSGCDQLVVGQIHARGGTFDLLMTEVHDLVLVTVVVLLGNSVHYSFGGHFDGTGYSKLIC